MAATGGASQGRRSELAANLAMVRARIDSAVEAAGRDEADVILIAVTKNFPAADAAALADLGVRDLGENRAQEAAEKVAGVAALTDATPAWHFVGQLQSNKAKRVARYADVVHSVDRASLVEALDVGVEAAGRTGLTVLVQVSLDGDTSRGGCPSEQVPALAALIAGRSYLRLGGVMAVAPIGTPAQASFQRLRLLSELLRSAHPQATMISAGMSGDLEAAVAQGATHLRIGTALLGRRGPDVG